MSDSQPEIDRNGTKWWWSKDRRLHRLDGPAVEFSSGRKEWWIYDKLHRLDGPAREWLNGDGEWWINGEPLIQQQFEQHPLVIFYRLSMEHR